MPTIRRATVADVPAMAQLINDAAEFGLMLPKSLASLYENVREFVVAEDQFPGEPASAGGGGGRSEERGAGSEGSTASASSAPRPLDPSAPSSAAIVGVCGLSIVWANLAEIVSLVVAPEARGQGLGKRLAQACLDEAEQIGIKRVMTLTYEQRFFESLGFAVVDRQKLPLKVWSECVRCPKNQACDEIAMIRELQNVTEQQAPKPQAPPPDAYIVPVTLSATRGETRS
jgi:amino-acid N-acetyltransferase